MKSVNISDDELARKIAAFISSEPVGTREVEAHFPKESRSKVLYRLQELRAQGRIKGRMIAAGGRGSWVWWA